MAQYLPLGQCWIAHPPYPTYSGQLVFPYWEPRLLTVAVNLQGGPAPSYLEVDIWSPDGASVHYYDAYVGTIDPPSPTWWRAQFWFEWLPNVQIAIRVRAFWADIIWPGPDTAYGDWSPWAHYLARWYVGEPVQPYMDKGPDSPLVAGSLDTPPAGSYITGWQGELYRDDPAGAVTLWAPSMEGIGGTSRRSEVHYGGAALTPGQTVRWRHRHQDNYGTIGDFSPWYYTVIIAESGPDAMSPLSPSTKLLTRTPTLTIGHSTNFDAYQWRLFRDGSELYDSGYVAVSATGSVAVTVPAGLLAWGDGDTVPLEWDAAIHRVGQTGTMGPFSPKRGLRINSLPAASLTVDGLQSGYVQTPDPLYISPYTDPDRLAYGENPTVKEWEIRVGAAPAGSGALVKHIADLTPVEQEQLGAAFVPTADVAYDLRVRYRDDATPKVSTTLAAASAASATNVKVTAITSLAIGDQLTLEPGTADEETRTITAVGTAGSGGTGITVDHGFTLAHANADVARVYYWGTWSSWKTLIYHVPPVVAAVAPAAGAVLADPTSTIDWTFTSTWLQTHALIAVYEVVSAQDQPILRYTQQGVATDYTLPPYLLATGRTYAWTVTAYDEKGFPGTSARRTFTTTFVAPAQLTGLVATPDAAASTVVLDWADSADAYFDHYRVWWQDQSGAWVRVDGGPETSSDGNPKLTTSAFTHLGARLGLNSYRVEASNGSQASTPATVTTTLSTTAAGRWVFAVPGGTPLSLRAMSVQRTAATITERFDPPGRNESLHLAWGAGPRGVTLTTQLRPSVEGDITTILDAMAAGEPGWLKAPAGWLWDPMWARVLGHDDTPQPGGLLSVSTSFEATSD